MGFVSLSYVRSDSARHVTSPGCCGLPFHLLILKKQSIFILAVGFRLRHSVSELMCNCKLLSVCALTSEREIEGGARMYSQDSIFIDLR